MHNRFYDLKLHTLSFFVVMLIAITVAFSKLPQQALESHEAFVLIAAQAMHDKQDWVVPWFNGEYRLNKPPMNYWLTAFVAWLDESLAKIQPWHGRAVSAFAGLGMIWLTLRVGKKLFDSETGLLAALMLSTSAGFFYYTHTARPEMLYAFFCTGAIAAYVEVMNLKLGSFRQYLISHLIWICFALATLTKGPHLPAMFLLAFVLDCFYRKLSFSQLYKTLQPLTGLLIFVAIALPWWYLLKMRVPAEHLANSQVTGSLLTINPLKALSFYYVYRPLQLMLPWLLLLPACAYLFKLKKLEDGTHGFAYVANIRLLILLCVLPALMLSFGPQKRWYYMLPSLIPMFLLLALGVMNQLRMHASVWSKGLKAIVFLLTLGTLVAVFSPLTQSPDRASEEQLAKLAAKQVASGKVLVSINVSPEVYAFYARKNVLHVYTNQALISCLREITQPVVLLIETDRVKNLPKNMQYSILGRAEGEESSVTLLELK